MTRDRTPMVSLCLNGFNGSPWFGGRADLPAWIDASAAAGFTLFAPDRFSLEAWEAGGNSLIDLARRMRDAGVGCGFIAAAALLDAGGDPGPDMAQAVRAAQTLGAPFIQVNVAAPRGPARLAAIETACAATCGAGIRIAIEYLPTLPLSSLAETLEMVRHVGVAQAGAMIDLWHHAHGPDDWQALERVPLDAIAYLEFCDALPAVTGDLHMEMMSHRTFPGDGVLDVARFASLFRARGYDGMVSVEVLNAQWRGRDPRPFATRAHAGSITYWK